MQNKVPAPSPRTLAMAGLLSILLMAPALGQETVESEEIAANSKIEDLEGPTVESTDTTGPNEISAVSDYENYEPIESLSADSSEDFPSDI